AAEPSGFAARFRRASATAGERPPQDIAQPGQGSRRPRGRVQFGNTPGEKVILIGTLGFDDEDVPF
ncbi:MAG: hypothetical protein QME96_04395, partial [Myxococcota bacterium]|nr:hypothetical protein [Myxococcota bacterium]